MQADVIPESASVDWLQIDRSDVRHVLDATDYRQIDALTHGRRAVAIFQISIEIVLIQSHQFVFALVQKRADVAGVYRVAPCIDQSAWRLSVTACLSWL